MLASPGCAGQAKSVENDGHQTVNFDCLAFTLISKKDVRWGRAPATYSLESGGARIQVWDTTVVHQGVRDE